MATPQEADKPTLRAICNELGDIKRKRFNIGIQLGISRNKLLEFEDEQDPFSAIIDHWLKGNAEESGVPITWKSIVKALKSKDVGEPRLAREIQQKYCHQQDDTKAFKKIEEELTCSICQNEYTNPKLLHCNHVYCQQCLNGLPVQNNSVSCPQCRQVTPMPSGGAEGLQAAFQTNRFLEIVDEHKKEKLAPFLDEEDCDSSTSSSNDTANCCPKHEEETMKIYCETCAEPICWKCNIKGGKHYNHAIVELSTFTTKKIKPLLEKAKEQLIEKGKAERKLVARTKEIKDQQITQKRDIRKKFARLQKILEDKEKEHIGDLEKCTQAKLKRIESQLELLQATREQLQSCLCAVKENLTINGKVLLTKTTELEELISTHQPEMLEPITEADMIFSELEDLSTECQNYGKVYATGSPDPSKCCAIGKGIDAEVALGEKSTFVLELLNFNGQPCKVPKESITCELASQITGIREHGSIEQNGENQYEISFHPTFKGRHQLHIKVEDQHIKGSPFPISVISPLEDLSSSLKTIDAGMKKPLVVAVNKKGEVIVTEYYEHCVSVYTPSGDRLRSFGTRGSNEGQFDSPYGVAVDGEENILVADRVNHRIQKLTANGEFLAEVGTKGTEPLQFSYPCGVAVSPINGRVYVADTENHRIQILSSDFTYTGTFGKRGTSKGQFVKPCNIACDSTGNVYVVDKNKIQVFTANGKFLRKLDKDRRHVQIPQGLAVDSLDRIFVSGEHHISVFTSKGEHLKSFGGDKEMALEASTLEVSTRLVEPMRLRGLAVDSSGVVYVCDHGNDCIQLF